jgi:hypothetical protein
MTETPILSGGATATDDGAGLLPDQSDFDGADGGNNRRLLYIVGAVVGLLILAAAAYLLLHKSSPSTTSGAVPKGVVVVHQPPVKQHTVVTHKTVVTKVPKVAKQPAARDPFKPLVTAPVATTGGAASSSTVSAPSTTPTTGTTGTTTGTTGTTGTTPVVTPTSGTTTTTGTGTTKGGPLWIQLMGTSGQTATFKVGYAHHKFRNFTVQAPKATSDQGTVFAKDFALISVQNGEATVQIGDGAPFILTQGVSHVV